MREKSIEKREGRHGHQHHGHGHGKKGKGKQGGAQTFRRGRAIDFLERLKLKQETLKSQLEQPELEAIQQVILGELKAIEMTINEFIQVFELYEQEGSPVEDSLNAVKKKDLPLNDMSNSEHEEPGEEEVD